MKKRIALGLAVMMVLILALTGCRSEKTADKYTDYVRAVMECSYRGEFERYIRFRDCNETEAQQVYDSTAENLAYNIMYYLSVDYNTVREETIAQYENLAKQILRKAKYTVNKAEKAGDTYHLKIEIRPMDFFDIILEDAREYAQGYDERLSEMEEISDAQAIELEEEYAQGMLNVVSPLVEKIGYGEVQTKIVEIVVDDEGYGLSDEDWTTLDNMVSGWE